jgi:multidrug efflux pump subunit AcrA (membrane-fusion protein)
MKRYGILVAFTGLAVAAILTAGRVAVDSMVKVTAVKVLPRTAEDTVVCTGKIESADSQNVYSAFEATVQKVYVREGERVSFGQTLMELAPTDDDSSDFSSSQPSFQSAYSAYSAYLNQSRSASSSSPSSALPQAKGSAAQKGKSGRALTASISGIVESVAVEGEYLSPSGKPAAVIRNSHEMQARLQVGESQAAKLKTGQKARISGVGFPSVYEGTVDFISSEAKQQVTATGQETVVEAVVKIQNPGTDVKPGLSAKVTITTSDSPNVLIVPYEAVRADEDGSEYVFRAVNGKAVKTPVTTGREFDSGFEIKKGIAANDAVIMDPNGVSDGSRVVPAYRKAADF